MRLRLRVDCKMTAKTKPRKTDAEYKAASRKRQRDAGLRCIEVLAYPEDVEPIKRYAVRKRKARESIDL